MDKSIGDNSDLYLNGETSDVMLSIGSLAIPAHKSVLMKHSEYFNAMFSIEMMEFKLNKVTLEEELPFGQQMLFVLKVVYGSRVGYKELQQITFEELFDAIIIANKYHFKRAEQTISELFFDKLNNYSNEVLYVRSVYYTKKSDKVEDSNENKENKGNNTNQDQTLSNIYEVLDISKSFNLEFFPDLCQNYIEKRTAQMLNCYKYYYNLWC